MRKLFRLQPGRVLRALIAIPPRPTERRCPLCEHRVGRFIPYPDGRAGVPALMRELDVVGSDVEHFECPRCGAHDRERHVFLYLSQTGLLSALEGRDVLHFAPEKRLSARIRAQKPVRYVKCDLYPRDADVVKVDMLQMPFEDRSFDLLIANHVLEHVDDDLRALSEIHRVLKVGGHAVLQTPFSRTLHRTWSDPGVVGDGARTQAFGQSDHVRLYGRDIFDRFASTGLSAKVIAHDEVLTDHDADRVGVNPDEPFFLFARER